MQANLEAEMRALDQVIAIYDPRYVCVSTESGLTIHKKRQKSPGTIEIDTLLERIELTSAVLEILQEAAKPLTTADCAVKLLQIRSMGDYRS